MPNTLLGLAIFAAGAGPGYLYVRLSQQRTPRYERTKLEEAVEFVVFGALASAAAVLLALVLGELTNLLDTKKIAADPSRYVATEPLRALGAIALVIAVSYGVVWLVTTRLLHPGDPVISRGETPWYAAFHRFVPKDHGVYVTVDLRDERAVAGLVVSYTLEAEEPRELVLARPIGGSLWLRTQNAQAVRLPDTFMILQGSDILSISGRYTPLHEGGEAAVG